MLIFVVKRAFSAVKPVFLHSSVQRAFTLYKRFILFNET